MVDIEHDIKIMDNLAKKLRARRYENGALSLDSLRLSFTLDDQGLPVDCGQQQRNDAKDLIQEVHALFFVISMTSNNTP